MMQRRNMATPGIPPVARKAPRHLTKEEVIEEVCSRHWTRWVPDVRTGEIGHRMKNGDWCMKYG